MKRKQCKHLSHCFCIIQKCHSPYWRHWIFSFNCSEVEVLYRSRTLNPYCTTDWQVTEHRNIFALLQKVQKWWRCRIVESKEFQSQTYNKSEHFCKLIHPNDQILLTTIHFLPPQGIRCCCSSGSKIGSLGFFCTTWDPHYALLWAGTKSCLPSLRQC